MEGGSPREAEVSHAEQGSRRRAHRLRHGPCGQPGAGSGARRCGGQPAMGRGGSSRLRPEVRGSHARQAPAEP
eukprot:1952522-Heterocapsa_arctica.AAC.1